MSQETIYLTDTLYQRLVTALVAAGKTPEGDLMRHGPENEIRLALVEVAGIMPASVRDDLRPADLGP